ncbi:rCG61391 [Rattus norvegicus]|uniref:RCG61391 n=1 Tax=Rattus norvegicus TaxID=10116 RepID=A6HBT9_RAT|nr:rCG61391 [Rattus norvegicus]
MCGQFQPPCALQLETWPRGVATRIRQRSGDLRALFYPGGNKDLKAKESPTSGLC